MTGLITHQERARLRHLLLDSVAPGPRRVYAMAGAPGAGKTTFVARARETGLFPASAFILNPDRVMEALQAYRDDYAGLGAEAAFARWELPARELAYALAAEAAARGLPIIKDMGMVRAENWQMLRNFRAQGYTVELHVLRVPLDVAEAGCAARERHFPAGQIEGRMQALDALLRQYETVPDAIFWYERSAHGFVRCNEPEKVIA